MIGVRGQIKNTLLLCGVPRWWWVGVKGGGSMGTEGGVSEA